MPSVCVRACLWNGDNVSYAVRCSFVEHICTLRATMRFCSEVEATKTVMTATVLLTRISNIFADFFFQPPFSTFVGSIAAFNCLIRPAYSPPPLYFFPQALTREVWCAISVVVVVSSYHFLCDLMPMKTRFLLRENE